MAMNSITEGFCRWRCPIRNNSGVDLYEQMHHFVEIRTFDDGDGFSAGERIHHLKWYRINPKQIETNRNES